MVKLLGITWAGDIHDVPQVAKSKSLYFLPLELSEKNSTWSGCLDFVGYIFHS